MTDKMKPNKKESNCNYFEFAGIFWSVLITFGMTALYFFAFEIEPILLQRNDEVTFITILQSINYYIIKVFQSQIVLGYVFYGAVSIHALESVFALAISLQMGCSNTYMRWTLQTLWLGYPSLRLLLQKSEGEIKNQ
jgi:hypothetical protein|mmetsp:Transcript_20718/g.20069  ORF Transcript_20718/g.20069 Transcript_20718/m.20069 type:complete len:137 (+) Transcript_20718:205-615(+)